MDLRCFRWSLIFLTFSRSQQVYPLPDPMTDKGPQPVNVRPYRYSLKKDEDEKIVREMLSLGIKKPSCSLFYFLVVLVGKKDTWHMCTHYRALNKMTVKDKFHIPVTDELLDEHHGANVSSKLHLPSVSADEGASIRCHKTVFRTHEGSLRFLIMPFGLTNALSPFQSLTDQVFDLI